MFVWADRIKETTATTGTGPLLLLGAQPTHFAFSSKLSDQDTCEYNVADQANGPNVEIGLGRYNAGTNTLSRLVVYASSNGGALVSFSGVVKDVFLDLPAYRIVADMGAVTPVTLGASVDDYTPGVGGMQRWSASVPINVTGMVAGIAGETRKLWNIGTQTITLTNQDVASAAANRWLTSSGANLFLLANCSALAAYDGVTSRWRVSLAPIGGNTIAPLGEIPYSDGAGGFRYDPSLNFVPPASASVFSTEDMLGIGHISVGSEARINNPSPIPYLTTETFTAVIMLADAVEGEQESPVITIADGIANHIDYNLGFNATYPYYGYDGRIISRASNAFFQGTVRNVNLQFINFAAANFNEATGITIEMAQNTNSAASNIATLSGITISISHSLPGTVTESFGVNVRSGFAKGSTIYQGVHISSCSGTVNNRVTGLDVGDYSPFATGVPITKAFAARSQGGTWDMAAGQQYDAPILHLRRPSAITGIVTTQMMIEMTNNIDGIVAGFQYDWQFMPVHRTDAQTAGNEGIYFTSTQNFLAYRDSGGTIHSLYSNGSSRAVFDRFADGPSVNTNGTEDDLYTNTLAANTFTAFGQKLLVDYCLTIVASETATRRIQAYVAGTKVLDSGTNVFPGGGGANVRLFIIAESTTVLRVKSEFVPSSATLHPDNAAAWLPLVTYTRITGLTLSSTQIVKVTGIATGTGAAAADITAVLGTGVFDAAV